jgi:hypothetical protein
MDRRALCMQTDVARTSYGTQNLTSESNESIVFASSFIFREARLAVIFARYFTSQPYRFFQLLRFSTPHHHNLQRLSI